MIRTLDLPKQQAAGRAKLRQLKKAIRRELASIWLREINVGAKRFTERLESKDFSKHDMIESPFYEWQSANRFRRDTAWSELWQELRNKLKAEHDRRIAFNRTNYDVLGDFTRPNHAPRNQDWAFEGLATEDGEAFGRPGGFSVTPSGTQAIVRVLPAGFFSHTLSEKLNAVVRSPLLPKTKKFVSYRAFGERQSVCRTVIATCTLPYFHTNRFGYSKLAWSTVNLEHLRTSPLRPFESYLEWATALDDQGYPVLNMPQTEYQAMLDNPRSAFGLTQIVAHDVDHPPLQDLKAKFSVFDSNVDAIGDLVDQYQVTLLDALKRFSNATSEPSDVYWINAFIEAEILSTAKDQSAELASLVDRYRALERDLATPKRIVGMCDQGVGFDVPILAGGDATLPQDLTHRGFLCVIERQIPSIASNGGSGRLRIAELIAHPKNSLTARVMTNRIWHYLMGRGIVRSVDNFGKLGDAPTHPELLDYLARRFRMVHENRDPRNRPQRYFSSVVLCPRLSMSSSVLCRAACRTWISSTPNQC